VPVDTDSKGTIDLANVQINASLSGPGPTATRMNEAHVSTVSSQNGAAGATLSAKRNPYNDSPGGHGHSSKQVNFQTLNHNASSSVPMSRQNN